MATIVFRVIVETEWEAISFPAAVTESKISNKMLLNYIEHCYNDMGLGFSDDEIENITLMAVTEHARPYIEQLSVAYFWPTLDSCAHADLHQIYRSDSQYSLFAKSNVQ